MIANPRQCGDVILCTLIVVLFTSVEPAAVEQTVRNINNNIICIALSALSLTGCGGGSASVDVATAAPPSFVVWFGSSGGDRVIDGPGHQFAFYSDTECLYNFQTGRENPAFCLVPGSDFVSYGAFHGVVLNVIAANGTCQAAIIDSITGNFSDIEIDAFGREVVLTTPLHPALCGP